MVFLGKDIFRKVISVCKRMRCPLSPEGNFSKLLKGHRRIEKMWEPPGGEAWEARMGSNRV